MPAKIFSLQISRGCLIDVMAHIIRLLQKFATWYINNQLKFIHSVYMQYGVYTIICE